jgi:hypothetical protein
MIVSRAMPVRALVAAAVGAVCLIVGFAIAPSRTAAAYLVAYAACAGIALGALALVMIARVTAAHWFVALRRQAEQVMATLPAVALLLLPILLAYRVLYPWATDAADAATRSAIHAKVAYLNAPFFFVRSVVYVGVWTALGEMLRRASLAQDNGDRDAARRMYVSAAVGLVAFAFTVSFASFDWFMSLAPLWYSTIYGVSFFAGAMVGGLALLTLIVAMQRHRGALPVGIGHDHFHALAKLLLTFVLFWVYIGFAQLIVIWSAALPVERTWYVVRMHGGWRVLAGVILVGHFAVPFCALLVRSLKRSVAAMSALATLLLVMHYADVYWTVMPDAPFHSGWGYVADAGALLFIGGIMSAVWSWRRVGEPNVPVGDPLLETSLEYSTQR